MLNIVMGLGIALGVCCVGMVHSAQAFSADAEAALQTEKEIYVATKRKSGEWSKAAPIWFMYDGEALYFTASPTSYKAKRIKRGSPVKVWIGRTDRARCLAHFTREERIIDRDLAKNYSEIQHLPAAEES